MLRMYVLGFSAEKGKEHPVLLLMLEGMSSLFSICSVLLGPLLLLNNDILLPYLLVLMID